jgi:hypothetical protein
MVSSSRMKYNPKPCQLNTRSKAYDCLRCQYHWTPYPREAAAALGCPLGTVASRAAALVTQGKIQPRPRGGAYLSRRVKARQEDLPARCRPSTVDHLRADLQAAVTAARQPVLARLEALEAGLARPPHDDGPRSTVDPETWELKQLKHSIRWTVYVPHTMKEELQRRAAARGENPCVRVQAALARWLAEEV